jgi:hypothetical protein
MALGRIDLDQAEISSSGGFLWNNPGLTSVGD